MRKLSVLFAACLVMSMAFASVAGAQTVFPKSDGSGETIGDSCPAGQFGVIPPNSLGEEGFACFDTQHEAAIYAETGEMPGMMQRTTLPLPSMQMMTMYPPCQTPAVLRSQRWLPVSLRFGLGALLLKRRFT